MSNIADLQVWKVEPVPAELEGEVSNIADLQVRKVDPVPAALVKLSRRHPLFGRGGDRVRLPDLQISDGSFATLSHCSAD